MSAPASNASRCFPERSPMCGKVQQLFCSASRQGGASQTWAIAFAQGESCDARIAVKLNLFGRVIPAGSNVWTFDAWDCLGALIVLLAWARYGSLKLSSCPCCRVLLVRLIDSVLFVWDDKVHNTLQTECALVRIQWPLMILLCLPSQCSKTAHWLASQFEYIYIYTYVYMGVFEATLFGLGLKENQREESHPI